MAKSFVVDYARTAGKVVYDSYRGASGDGEFSFRDNGTLDDHVSSVEITKKGDVFGRHADLTQYLKDAQLSGTRQGDLPTFESHHLIPAEILGQVGISRDDGIAVMVDAGGHMNDIHGYGGLEKGLVFTDVNQLKNYYREEYAALGAPEWGDKACEFVDANRDQFTRGLADVAAQLEAAKVDPLAAPPPEATQEAVAEPAASQDAVADAATSDNV